MLAELKKAIRRLLTDDEGATLVEYALIAGLIAAVCVLIVTQLGHKTGNYFGHLENAYPNTP